MWVQGYEFEAANDFPLILIYLCWWSGRCCTKSVSALIVCACDPSRHWALLLFVSALASSWWMAAHGADPQKTPVCAVCHHSGSALVFRGYSSLTYSDFEIWKWRERGPRGLLFQPSDTISRTWECEFWNVCLRIESVLVSDWAQMCCAADNQKHTQGASHCIKKKKKRIKQSKRREENHQISHRIGHFFSRLKRPSSKVRMKGWMSESQKSNISRRSSSQL